MCNERSHSICCYNNVRSTHFKKSTNKIKENKRHFPLSFSLLHLFIPSCKFVIIETRTFDIAHDEGGMSTLMIQGISQGQAESSHRCSITKAVYQNFAIFTGKYLC